MIWKSLFNNGRNGMGIEEVPVDSGISAEEVKEMPEASAELPKEHARKEGPEYSFRITIDMQDDNQIGRAALLLASTSSHSSENELKSQLGELKWKSVATEIGGLAGDIPQKITRALVGASLNAGVIEKNQKEMHALMHAAVEAMEGFLQKGMLEASIGAKIGIVRNSKWIAVAVMGDTAYHAVAHHERCGLGVMHL